MIQLFCSKVLEVIVQAYKTECFLVMKQCLCRNVNTMIQNQYIKIFFGSSVFITYNSMHCSSSNFIDK